MEKNVRIEVMPHPTPAGVLLIAAWQGRICLCDWAHSRNGERLLRTIERHTGAVLADGFSDAAEVCAQQIDEYFAGRRRDFDLDLLMCGTDFQKIVWHELLKIPFGTFVSYADVAKRIGRPSAVRAVANAVGANPMSIIVPCHRVIGSDGSLTGYAAGLATKLMLVQLESPNPCIP